MLLAANPTRFMDHYQQQHQSSSRYKSTHQPEQHRGPGASHQEDSPDFITAVRHDYANGTAVAPLPSPQDLLGLADLPPSTAAVTAAAAAGGGGGGGDGGPTHFPAHSSRHPRDATATGIISNRAGPGHGFPTDAERGAGACNSSSNRALLNASHHYHYHQHQHQHHFNAALNGRQRVPGGSGGGGSGHGEDDFEFLRCILLDAGDGTAHAAHSTAPRPPGSAGYLPVSTLAHAAVAATAVSNANEMGFAPISAARATSFAPVSSAPQALHASFPQSSTLVSGVRSFPTQTAFLGAGAGGGTAGVAAATTARDTHVGRTGSPAFGRSGGGAEDMDAGVGGHVTEDERLEAADDVARCIWLAGDELRDILLARVWGIWRTAEAEIAEESNVNAAAVAGVGDRSPSSPSASPRRFNQVFVERLRATCQAVEADVKAAKANGDASALCAPPPQQWRGGAALRRDVLARLEAYQRNNRERCGELGSGHGRFSSINCLDALERQQPGSGLAAGSAPAASMASDSNLKHDLESALTTTRGGVKSELLMFGEDEADRSCNVAGSRKQPAVESGRRAAAAAAAAAGDASTTTGGKRKKKGTGGGAAPADNSGRKRKRSGNGRRCKHEGCLLHPHFGLTRPEYCSKHKLPGMFNVKGRRCVHPECTRTPVYGKSGDPHPTYCAAHKLAGYVDIKNPTCRDPTCFRQPSFGSASDRKATYCASHMLSGMVNVRRMLASFKSASVSAAANANTSGTATAPASAAGAGAPSAPAALTGGAGGVPASGGRSR